MSDQTRRVAGRWLGRIAVAFSPFPRNSYLPPQVRGTPPLQPEGTDLAIWSYESQSLAHTDNRTQYNAIAFAANQNKPLWHTSFGNEASRRRAIEETIKERKAFLERKQKQQEERKQFVHSFKEGDILSSSWGYDQTNVDFYQVTKVIGKAVEIRSIESKIVSGSGGPSEAVIPVPNHFSGPPLRKIPTGNCLRLTSYSSACPWEGHPLHQTGGGWGH